MTIDRAISDMDAQELRAMIIKIHNVLWNPGECWESIEWTPEILERVAEVFDDEDLHPYSLAEYNE